jgi:hypothetical protein
LRISRSLSSSATDLSPNLFVDRFIARFTVGAVKG